MQRKPLNKSNSGLVTLQKAEIIGLESKDIEYGEDELRNEHDFRIFNFNTESFVEGRFIITRLKIIFIPYDDAVADDIFLK